jgi:hypothetical protein
LFTWTRGLRRSPRRSRAPRRPATPTRGDTYYHHWLAALERLVAETGAGSPDEQERTRDAWRHAAHRTPHGHPIDLLGTARWVNSAVRPSMLAPQLTLRSKRCSAARAISMR